MKWFDVRVLNEDIALRALGETAQEVKDRFETQLQRLCEVREAGELHGWHPRTNAGGGFEEARHHPSREPAEDGEVRLGVGGAELHVFKDGRSDGDDVGDWCAWLNTGVSDFDGLCLASGEDRHEVLASVYGTAKELMQAAVSLQKAV